MASNWESGQGNHTGGGEPTYHNNTPGKHNPEESYGSPKQTGNFNKGVLKNDESNRQYRDENIPPHHQTKLNSSEGQRDDVRGYQGGPGGHNGAGGGQGRDSGGGQGRDYGGGQARDYGGGQARDYGGGQARDYGGGQGRDYGGGQARDYGGGQARDYGRGQARDYGGGQGRDYGGGQGRDYGGGQGRNYGGGQGQNYGGGQGRDYGGGQGRNYGGGQGRNYGGGQSRDYGGGQGRNYGGGQGRNYGGGQGRDYGGGQGRDYGGGQGRDYGGGQGRNHGGGQGRDYGGGQGRNYGGGQGRDYSGDHGRGHNSGGPGRGGNHHGAYPNERQDSRLQQQNGYQDGAGKHGPSRRDGGPGDYGHGSSSRGGMIEGSGRVDNREPTPTAYQSPSNIPRAEVDIFDSIPQGSNFNHYEHQKGVLTGDNSPDCITTFDEAHLSQTVMENIAKSNYKQMTPIQKYAIPAILDERDLMGCAETGSGKTAAFLIPIISLMLKHSRYSNPNINGCLSPTALILVPTRELALQIYQESQKFAYSSNIKTGIYYGGTSLMHQQRILSEGCHILVATPGRLLDCLEKGKVILSQVRFLVIDEADRMLDMGFIPSVKNIVFKFDLPNETNRRTIMFSATFPEEIQLLSCDFLNRKYLFLTIGKSGAAANGIKQEILRVPQSDKLNKLMELLTELQGQKILVFVENKRQADLLASQVCQEHMQATSIHGSRLQQEREHALFEFKSGKRPILIATSVAARGLDIRKVDHVINYDMPRTDINEYVHRIGRTGRIGNSGKATSFFDPRLDSCIARGLVYILALSEQDVPPFLEEIAHNAIGTNTGFGVNCGEFGGKDYRTHYQDSSPRHIEHSHQNYLPDAQRGGYDHHPIEQIPHRTPPSNPAQSPSGKNPKDHSVWD